MYISTNQPRSYYLLLLIICFSLFSFLLLLKPSFYTYPLRGLIIHANFLKFSIFFKYIKFTSSSLYLVYIFLKYSLLFFNSSFNSEIFLS